MCYDLNSYQFINLCCSIKAILGQWQKNINFFCALRKTGEGLGRTSSFPSFLASYKKYVWDCETGIGQDLNAPFLSPVLFRILKSLYLYDIDLILFFSYCNLNSNWFLNRNCYILLAWISNCVYPLMNPWLRRKYCMMKLTLHKI